MSGRTLAGDEVSVVVRMRELVADGRRQDGSLPADVVAELEVVLEGLEHDLAPRPRGIHCGNCGLRLRFPGELDDHLRAVHWGVPWRKAEAA